MTQKDDQIVWVCACGCTTHYFYYPGELRCASCEKVMAQEEAGEWLKYLPSVPIEPPTNYQKGHFKLIEMNSTDARLNRMQRIFTERRREIVMALLIYANGQSTKYQLSVEDIAQAEWLKKKLQDVIGDIDEEVRTRGIAEEVQPADPQGVFGFD